MEGSPPPPKSRRMRRILIDCDNRFIRDDRIRFVGLTRDMLRYEISRVKGQSHHLFEIVSQNERAFEDGPHREMSN